MMAGKPEMIAGARNRWMMLLTRLAPRTMLASIARGLNSGTSTIVRRFLRTKLSKKDCA